MNSRRDRGLFFWGTVAIATVIGIFLRIYLLNDQILLNDEWHGIYFVQFHPFVELFTHFTRNANSIPMNLYRAALLHTIGWNETLLRLPSLLSGIFLIPVLAYFTKRHFGNYVAASSALLLAISPLLILYSRTSRGYATSVLLSSIAFFCSLRWVRTHKKKDLIAYLVAAPLAVYFHITSIVTVFAPLCITIVLQTLALAFPSRTQRRQNQANPISTFKLLVPAGVLILVLYLPAILNDPWVVSIVSETHKVNMYTFIGMANLMAGSTRALIMFFFCITLARGFGRAFQKDRSFSASLLFAGFMYVAVFLIAKWETIYLPIETARFSLSLLPLLLIISALGCQDIGEYLVQHLPRMPAKFVMLLPFSLLWVALVSTSPLLETYRAPSNFSNHAAFNETYKKRGWDRSYASQAVRGYRTSFENIPFFYKTLPESDQALIEYPSCMGDNCNLWYYYQHFHMRPILEGYFTSPPPGPWMKQDRIIDTMFLDYALSYRANRSSYLFYNLIDLSDTEALLRSNASHIILHKNIFNEYFKEKSPFKDGLFYRPIAYLRDSLQKNFGKPVLEDQDIIVFEISQHEGREAFILPSVSAFAAIGRGRGDKR